MTRTKTGTLKPPNYATLNSFHPSIFPLTETTSVGSTVHLEPSNMFDALTNPEWKAAMKAEYDALIVNNT